MSGGQVPGAAQGSVNLRCLTPWDPVGAEYSFGCVDPEFCGRVVGVLPVLQGSAWGASLSCGTMHISATEPVERGERVSGTHTRDEPSRLTVDVASLPSGVSTVAGVSRRRRNGRRDNRRVGATSLCSGRTRHW